MHIIKSVIASEAKQSIDQDKAGLLRRFAPRNDEVGSGLSQKDWN